VWQIPDAVDTVVCAPDDGRKYYPKHVEQFTDINKQCNVAFCWIYIGILLAYPILHISRIRVKAADSKLAQNVDTYLPKNTASYLKRLESWTLVFWTLSEFFC
jgi:hypothetical protein